MPRADTHTQLTCEECQRPWEGWQGVERGWQAFWVDVSELAIYCPECAEREFGDE